MKPTQPILPIPDFFQPEQAETLWKVDYQSRFLEARTWAKVHQIPPASEDRQRNCLLAVDLQCTFCLPQFDLFVRGRTGRGAVEDVVRLCRFIYRNLHRITRIFPTLDSHHAIQIFHPGFLVDNRGRHPHPFTVITEEDIRSRRWQITPAILEELEIDTQAAVEYLLHYTRFLGRQKKYQWTVWPYHALIGSVGHGLVPLFEETVFFHGAVRHTQPDFLLKGENPLTEHYSALGPEVDRDPAGRRVGAKNTDLIRKLSQYDRIIIAGEAKSHCVAWTIADLLEDPLAVADGIPEKLYLLEDCSSPVVIPGVIDYTERTKEILYEFESRGVKRVQSTVPIEEWPSS